MAQGGRKPARICPDLASNIFLSQRRRVRKKIIVFLSGLCASAREKTMSFILVSTVDCIQDKSVVYLQTFQVGWQTALIMLFVNSHSKASSASCSNQALAEPNRKEYPQASMSLNMRGCFISGIKSDNSICK